MGDVEGNVESVQVRTRIGLCPLCAPVRNGRVWPMIADEGVPLGHDEGRRPSGRSIGRHRLLRLQQIVEGLCDTTGTHLFRRRGTRLRRPEHSREQSAVGADRRGRRDRARLPGAGARGSVRDPADEGHRGSRELGRHRPHPVSGLARWIPGFTTELAGSPWARGRRCHPQRPRRSSSGRGDHRARYPGRRGRFAAKRGTTVRGHRRPARRYLQMDTS